MKIPTKTVLPKFCLFQWGQYLPGSPLISFSVNFIVSHNITFYGKPINPTHNSIQFQQISRTTISLYFLTNFSTAGVHISNIEIEFWVKNRVVFVHVFVIVLVYIYCCICVWCPGGSPSPGPGPLAALHSMTDMKVNLSFAIIERFFFNFLCPCLC